MSGRQYRVKATRDIGAGTTSLAGVFGTESASSWSYSAGSLPSMREPVDMTFAAHLQAPATLITVHSNPATLTVTQQPCAVIDLSAIPCACGRAYVFDVGFGETITIEGATAVTLSGSTNREVRVIEATNITLAQDMVINATDFGDYALTVPAGAIITGEDGVNPARILTNGSPAILSSGGITLNGTIGEITSNSGVGISATQITINTPVTVRGADRAFSQAPSLVGFAIEGVVVPHAAIWNGNFANTNAIERGTGVYTTAVHATAPRYVQIRQAFAGGDGTSGNPYLIHDFTALSAMRDYVNANATGFRTAYYEVTADIAVWNEVTNWEPIGNASNRPFQGVFDGGGYIISNMRITGTNMDRGLFGTINGTNAVVRNVALENVNINSSSGIVGGIVGRLADGTIENCYVSGSITGGSRVGGIVGENVFGTVSNSYTTANVSGNEIVGGIVGANSGTVENNVALNPSITRTGGTDANFGRVVGGNWGGTLTNNHAWYGMEFVPSTGGSPTLTFPTAAKASNNINGACVFAYEYPDIVATPIYNSHLVTRAVTVNATPAGASASRSAYPANAAAMETVTLSQSANAGYTFNNWTSGAVTIFDGNKFEMGNAAVSVTANYAPIQYSIAYTLNGGTVSINNPTNYTIITPTITLHNPTRVGYTFTGWTWGVRRRRRKSRPAARVIGILWLIGLLSITL